MATDDRWQLLAEFTLNDSWQFTPEFTGNAVRVTHYPLEFNKAYLKAVIAQGYCHHQEIPIIYNPQRLTFRDEIQIFKLDDLTCFDKNTIGFRRLDNNPSTWKIKIEVFNMLIYSASSYSSAQPSKAIAIGDILVTRDKKLILPEELNNGRKSFLIVNGSNTTLYFKYLPMGGKLEDIIITTSDYDFYVTPGNNGVDNYSTQNGIVAVNSLPVNSTLKVTKFMF